MKKIILILLTLLFSYFVKQFYYDTYDSKNIKVVSNFKYHFITFKKNKTDFSVVDKKDGDYNFYVNSNFFTKKRTIIGGLTINKKVIKRQTRGGGSFVVKNGTPDIVFNKQYNCDYLTQTNIWVIKNNIINENMLKRNHAKKKVARLLIGKNKKGEINIIHTNLLFLVTMENIVKTAKDYGLTDAFILDSGSSIDVKLEDGIYTHRFMSIPTLFKPYLGIHEPVSYIAGNFK
jgi:hypothetical protein